MKLRRILFFCLLVAVVGGAAIFALPIKAEAAVVDSGTCGDKLVWTLDSDGTLVISGTGAMYDYEHDVDYVGNTVYNSCSSPFYNEKNIKRVVIEDGVTSVGAYAFYWCYNLVSVELPDSLNRIGSFAFLSCGKLETVKMSNNIESVGSRAFLSCKNLNYNKYHTAKYLGTEANPYLVLVETTSEYISSCNINEGTRVIAGEAFAFIETLTTITVPNDVVSICEEAFSCCSNLTTIVLGENVRSIEERAFHNCEKLTQVNYTGTESQWKTIAIGEMNDYLRKATLIFHTHNYTTITVGATCTSTGYAKYTCDCGDSYRDELPALGHYMVELPAVAPTCVETGWTTGTACERCSFMGVAQKEVAALGGNCDYTTDSTTCANCGYVRADVDITNVVLRPTCSGLYFKGSFAFGAHETVTRYGIAVSLYNALPVADDSDETSLYTVGENSVLISNILDSSNGKNLIYARPYVLLADGTYIYGDVVATNLKAVVETIETQVFDSLTTAQKTAIADMYLQHTAAMQNWLIPKIKEFGEA